MKGFEDPTETEAGNFRDLQAEVHAIILVW